MSEFFHQILSTVQLNFLSLVMELPTLHWSTNTDADEMKSQALINARRAFQDQEARVQYVLLLENVSVSYDG